MISMSPTQTSLLKSSFFYSGTNYTTSLCLFILFMGFSRQEYWSGLPFPYPVDHILSELSTMTHPFWVARHGMAHSFIELDKAVVHVIRLQSNICWIIEKVRQFQKNIYFCFIDYAKAFECPGVSSKGVSQWCSAAWSGHWVGQCVQGTFWRRLPLSSLPPL